MDSKFNKFIDHMMMQDTGMNVAEEVHG